MIMSSILKSIHKLEDRFDNRAERFAFRHPHAAVLAMFIGLRQISAAKSELFRKRPCCLKVLSGKT